MIWYPVQLLITFLIVVGLSVQAYRTNTSSVHYGLCHFWMLLLLSVGAVGGSMAVYLLYETFVAEDFAAVVTMSVLLLGSGYFAYRSGPALVAVGLLVSLAVSFFVAWDDVWRGQYLAYGPVYFAGTFLCFLCLLATPLPPYGDYTVFGAAYFTWVGDLFRSGSSRPLQLNDCFALPPDIAVSVDARWNFWKDCGWRYVGLGLLKFTCDTGAFASPLLLNSFLTYLETDSANRSKGWLIVVGLLTSTLVITVFRTQYDFAVRRLSLRVQSTLISAVFRLALVTPSHDLHSYSTGEVMNYVCVDTQRVADAVPSFNEFWSLPIQVGISLFLLYREVSWSFLAGLGVVVTLIPLNMRIARRLQRETQTMMAAKDVRVNSVSEFIGSIKVVKLHAWEGKVATTVAAARAKEFKALRTRKYLDSWCVYLWATTPVLVTLATFATYILAAGGTLTATRAFTCITLFNMLIYPINAFPWVINGLMEAQVSHRRLMKFLATTRSNSTHIKHRSLAVTVNSMSFAVNSLVGSMSGTSEHFKLVDVSRAYFEFYENSKFKLSNISLSAARGDLIGITGPHGSGKSTLLRALNGHMRMFGGYSVVRGSVAYVAQEPFLLCDTIRENILFGSEYRHGDYTECLQDTALDVDIQSFPERDHTLVGGSGMTLSGGQKMRVSLARALYHDHCVVYLFDDILSCLDDTTAEHVFNRVIMELVTRGKCVFFVSHEKRFLKQTATVHVMAAGGIVQSASTAHTEERYTLASPSAKDAPVAVVASERAPPDDAEHREVGHIDTRSHTYYYGSVGVALSSTVVGLCLLMQASRNACDVWLTYWVADSSGSQPESYYLTVLAYFSAANSGVTFLRSFVFAYAGLKGAQVIHDDVLLKVLHAPFAFFTINPPGRIVNRFSRDQFAVDEDLPFQYNIVLAQLFLLVGSVVIMSMGSWVVAVCFLPVLFVYFRVQRYYRMTSRELKRLDSTSRSPLYDRVRDVISGSEVMTGFGPDTVAMFLQNICATLRVNLRVNYTTLAASEWFGIRLQLLGFAMLSAVAVVGMLEFEEGTTARIGTFGLALSYALPITSYLSGLVNSFAEFEKQFISVERIQEYSMLPQEGQAGREGDAALATSWPVHGEVAYRDVSVQYSEDAEPSVRSVTLTVPAGAKVGIVGRTGSGKSTLLNAVLRLVPGVTGGVYLDDVDVSTISLGRLRSSVAVISQDVVLFSGTLRRSIDPFDDFEDTALERALSDVGMGHLGPSFVLEEGGRNLSVGERQLLALACVLLRPRRVLLMDEATAALDAKTEATIFSVLLEKFAHMTVICVSHKLENLKGFDTVVVMDKGAVIAKGPPSSMLSKVAAAEEGGKS